MSRNQDFAHCLHRFFEHYLNNSRNVSQNTLKAYSNTFKLLFKYMEQKYKIPPHKFLFQDFNAKNIEGFLDWLEYERHCCITTRNQRLGAIHSFCRYIEIDYPEYLLNIQSIMLMKMKKAPKNEVAFLKLEAMKLLLTQPNIQNEHEFRDLVLLSILYDVGARASEVTEIKLQDIFLQSPASVRLHGKGDKYRQVPLMSDTVKLLKKYLMHRNRAKERNDYLFLNPSGNQLSRGGVTYILQKYWNRAKKENLSLFPTKISPNILRHSKAMHLLQAGVDLVYIRDFLGHSDIKTTEIYARADPEMKRNALEKAYSEIAPKIDKDWCDDNELLRWLSSF